MNKEIEAVQWMVENQGYYSFQESEKQTFQELVKYGSNIHTYTAEALSVYRKIQEKFLNNPYFYGTTNSWHRKEEKNKHTVFSHSIRGYFITVPDGDKQVSVPFGVYQKWVPNDEYIVQVQKFLRERKQELIRYEQQIVQKVAREIDQLESQILTLTTEAFSIDTQKKSMDLSAEEQIWKEKRKQDALAWLAYLAVIFVLRLMLHQGEQEFIRACIPFGLVMLWRQWRKFLVKKQRNKMRKQRQMLLDYNTEYQQKCSECIKKIDDMRAYEMETSGTVTKGDMREANYKISQYWHHEKKPQGKPAWGKTKYRLFLFLAVCTIGYALYVWYQYFSTYIPD